MIFLRLYVLTHVDIALICYDGKVDGEHKVKKSFHMEMGGFK